MDLFDAISQDEQQAAAEALKRHHQGVDERRQVLASIADQRRYQAMLDSVADWRPPELPPLDAFDSIILNFETNGVRWYDGDRIISGVLKTPDGISRYLPIRHAMGPNIPEERFFEWLRREVRSKHIDNENIRFDLHMVRAEGIDLEQQGCTFGDPAHYAALLDDHRRQFNLDLLSKDILVWDVETDGLGKLPPGVRSEGEFHKLPAGLVAPYGLRNVEQVDRLLQVFKPQIVAQELERVLAIEQQVIPVVVEMEHNGAPLDVELLDRFIRDSQAEIQDALYQVKKATGLDFEKTNRGNAERLFNYLKLPFPRAPKDVRHPEGEWSDSFADALLRDINEPSVQQYRRAAQLESLNSKFLVKYRKSVSRDGILRYALHQLPYQKEEGSDSTRGGAVSGRFSSAALTSYAPDGRRVKEGGNIQQVFGVDTQKKSRPFTAPYLVKRLFVPGTPGAQYFNADASQLQFRIFAHYAEDPKVIAAYNDNPRQDYHQVVHDLIKEFSGIDLSRTYTKNVNFACVAPHTPILNADLSWVRADSLKIGDALLAFDEHRGEGHGRRGARRWRMAFVTGNILAQRPCCRITLENGETLVATVDHSWIVKGHHIKHDWIETQHLMPGMYLTKAVDVWQEDVSKDAGWLAGFLDGEGSATTTSHVVVNQNEGPLFDRCVALLENRSIRMKVDGPGPGRTTAQVRLKGQVSDRLRFLGEIRPGRLIHDFVRDLTTDTMFQARDHVKVVSVQRIGDQPISALGTSEQTYLAQGYAAHNTIFGAGSRKRASQLGVPADQIPSYDEPLSKGGPLFQEVLALSDTYHEMFPGVKPLLALTSHLAMPGHGGGDRACGRECRRFHAQGYEHRGWVRTYLGRRRRFGPGDRFYSALNGIIQGTEADLIKRVLIEVHKRRNELGLIERFTVHDALAGDLHGDPARLKEILNTQYYPLKVPILWEVGIGRTWADAK